MDVATSILPKGQDPFLDVAEVFKRGVVRSGPTLFRYTSRKADENPFPQPLRHTHTGRRYWRLSWVVAWEEREQRRMRAKIRVEDLMPDTDPARWSPKARAKAA